MILPDLLDCKDNSSENSSQISETKLSRQKRREKKLELYQAHKKLLQRLSQVNLPVQFDNDTTTAFGNFSSLATFF